METDKLLQTIYNGCDMAVDSIGYLLDYVDKEEMLGLLEGQREKFYKLKAKVKLELEQMGFSEFDEVSKPVKMMSKMTTVMRMMTNRNSEKIAKMMKQGIDMAVEKLTKNENNLIEYNEPIPEISEEYRKLLNTCEKQLDRFM